MLSWLNRSQSALAEALSDRMFALNGSVFRLVGLDACRRLAITTFSALREDLSANHRNAIRAVIHDLVQTMCPLGLSFHDLRFYGQSLRRLVLGDADADGTLDPAARGKLEEWLFDAIVVAAIYYLSYRERFLQERAAVEDVRRLEAQLVEYKTLNDSLEVKVRERTADLAARNASLAEALGDLQRTQEQLIHSEKMASLGLLVAGIAHEIKNPLNFVNNFAEISLEFIDEIEQLTPDLAGTASGAALVENLSELTDNLRRIHEHGRRADTIINAMSVHAHERAATAMVADLNDIVHTHTMLAYQGFRARDRAFTLEIVEALDSSLATAVSQEFSRVILNLVTNACHALRERQRLTGPGYQPTLRVATRRVGDVAVLEIEDNGVGIPAKLRSRIFEPFFTTKPPGEGTGLGLSMCYEIIVKQLGGHLTVESSEGERSMFTVSLPAHTAAGTWRTGGRDNQQG